MHLENGSHERPRGRTEVAQQRGEGWQAPGSHSAVLQGHRQVPASYAEARYGASLNRSSNVLRLKLL